ncbi:cytokine receptor common subunit gamma-like [Arapaima gigas]
MAAAVAAAVLLAMVAVPPGRVRGTPALGVSCVIVNLEHTDCSWRHVPSPQSNYTFQSRLGDRGSYSDCPRYLLQGGYTVGCRLPYTLLDRFKTLHLRLTHDSALAWEQTVQLLNQVKLNPPHNLSVEVNRQNQELWLYWNHSVKSNCRENQVMYRRNEESQWQFSTLLPADFYSLPQASLKSQYEFKVKTRVSNTCGMSEFWSDWGPPVWWYPAEQSNQTGPELGVDFQHKGYVQFLLCPVYTAPLTSDNRLKRVSC